jgi:NitT/TauT family transport system permease protein
MRRTYTSTIFFVILFILWEILARSDLWSDILLPSPSEIGQFYINTIADGTLIDACFVTLKRLVEGYVVGIIIGVPMGLLNSRFQLFEDTIGVVALGLQALPSICWAPLAILWLGQTEAAMFFIVIMGSIWSIALATDAGVRNVPPIYVRAARTMGSKGLHTWFYVILPAAFPFIITGMKQGWAFAWRSLMAAEIYITIITGFGLGHMLHYARELHSMDGVIGIMLLIIAIGLTFDRFIFNPLEQFLHKRWGTQPI